MLLSKLKKHFSKKRNDLQNNSGSDTHLDEHTCDSDVVVNDSDTKLEEHTCDSDVAVNDSDTKLEERTCDSDVVVNDSDTKLEEHTCDSDVVVNDSDTKLEERTCDSDVVVNDSGTKLEERTCDSDVVVNDSDFTTPEVPKKENITVISEESEGLSLPKLTALRIKMIAKKSRSVAESCEKTVLEKYDPSISDYWLNVGLWLKHVSSALELQSKLVDKYGITVEIDWECFDKYPNFSVAKKAFEQYITKLFINDHDVLKRKRNQMVYIDEFDEYNFKDFYKYIWEKYIEDRISPKVFLFKEFLIDYCDREWTRNLSTVDIYDECLDKMIDAIYEDRSSDNNLDTDDPYEYESLVANKLCELGWKAYATSGSGDQGADVIAERHGRRYVIQCKLYSKPVGNKAVQEVTSARCYYEAFGAVVVTNNDYTKSARQLAESQNTFLLHDSELERFTESVDNIKRSVDLELNEEKSLEKHL